MNYKVIGIMPIGKEEVVVAEFKYFKDAIFFAGYQKELTAISLLDLRLKEYEETYGKQKGIPLELSEPWYKEAKEKAEKLWKVEEC